MPVWSEIIEELQQTKKKNGRPDFDSIRGKYLAQTHQFTKRNVILYAAKCTQPDPNARADLVSIIEDDIQGMMEVTHGLKGSRLDLILHSPGGSPEAAEAIVTYLRSKFSHIRVIVPRIATSAATLIACAGNRIVMGKHSFLGPIDPQLLINTPLGPRMVSAQAILEQFTKARDECQDPAKMAAWLPMLAQYGPDLLVQCEHLCKMSQLLVEDWLSSYMFRRRTDRKKVAKRIAKWLSNHAYFKSHGRNIARAEAKKRGLTIDFIESNQKAQDLFLSVFHAATHTFDGTGTVKIIENHLGKVYIKRAYPVTVDSTRPAGPASTNQSLSQGFRSQLAQILEPETASHSANQGMLNRSILRAWINTLLNEVVTKRLDPYEYLNDYLTDSEIEEVLRLPKRSREQVDRIIEIVDASGICDQALRENIYKAFGVDLAQA